MQDIDITQIVAALTAFGAGNQCDCATHSYKAYQYSVGNSKELCTGRCAGSGDSL